MQGVSVYLYEILVFAVYVLYSYGDAVKELDFGVGAILSALEARGIANNTLVLFSSDNGASLFSGPHQGKI